MRATGMAIGGVTPFALPPDLEIWIDGEVMRRERLVLGGGSRAMKVLAPPATLAALPNATVVEGSGDHSPGGLTRQVHTRMSAPTSPSRISGAGSVRSTNDHTPADSSRSASAR